MAKKKVTKPKKAASKVPENIPVLIKVEGLQRLKELVMESNVANQRVQDYGEGLRVALGVPKGWGVNLQTGQFEPLQKPQVLPIRS